jgi:hypothetical protein
MTGWEPLCAFLDVPVPEHEPFPHANETAAFEALFGRIAPAPLES